MAYFTEIMAYFTEIMAANIAVMTATEVALLAIAVAIFAATIAVAIVAPLPLTPPPPPAPWDEDDELIEAAVLSVAELSATDSHYGLDLRRLRRRLAGMDPSDGEGRRCPRCGLHEDDRDY